MVTIFSCTNIQIVCVHGCVFFKYLTHFMNGLYPGCLESKGLKNVFLIAATSNQKTHKSLAHTAKKRCRRAQGKQLHFQKNKKYFRKQVLISGTSDDFLLNVANYTTLAIDPD